MLLLTFRSAVCCCSPLLAAADDAGAVRQLRDPVYSATYDAVQSAVQESRPLLGSLYWKWAVPGLPKGGRYSSSDGMFSSDVDVSAASSEGMQPLFESNPYATQTSCYKLLVAGPYDVEYDDSTMGVIKTHANVMHRLVNAIPPRPGCVLPASPDKVLGAWFASANPDADDRGCVNAPEVSLAYYSLYGPGGTPTATAEELGLSATSVAYANALYDGKVWVYATKADCCRAGGLGAYPKGCTV